MKTLIRIATPVLAVALMGAAPLFAQTQSAQTETQAQSRDWNTPPAGVQQQAYRDGIQAHQLDKAAKRPIDARHSHLYLHPSAKGDKDQYRTSFVAGYEAAQKHDTGE